MKKNLLKNMKSKSRINWLIDTGASIGLIALIYFALKGIALLYLLIKGWLWIEGLK